MQPSILETPGKWEWGYEPQRKRPSLGLLLCFPRDSSQTPKTPSDSESHTLGDELESSGGNISRRSEKYQEKANWALPPLSTFHCSSATGIQFLHHQCRGERNFGEHLVWNFWMMGKPRPVEGRSVAQHRGGTRTPTLTPILGGTTESTSQMASESSNTAGGNKDLPSQQLKYLGIFLLLQLVFHFWRLWACPRCNFPSCLSSTSPSQDWPQ